MSENLGNAEENQSQGNSEPNASASDPLAATETTNVASWHDSLPEELKNDKSLTKFKDVPSLAKSYLEAQKTTSKALNAKGVIIPGENATPEEISEYRKALGVPATADGYELESPTLPEGMVVDEAKAKKLAEIAHSKGISKEAFQELAKAYNAEQIAAFEAQKQEQAQKIIDATAEMKKEWGRNFEKNLAQSEAAIVSIFGPEFNQFLQENGLGSDTRLIKGMFKASQNMSEHQLVTKGMMKDSQKYSWEGLVSMKMDDRYHARDPLFMKQVAEYNAKLAESMDAS